MRKVYYIAVPQAEFNRRWNATLNPSARYMDYWSPLGAAGFVSFGDPATQCLTVLCGDDGLLSPDLMLTIENAKDKVVVEVWKGEAV
tara:strand:+ start:859 stop:1119 length:261 start_codon:yes stop_codon:yes gene_type:complete